MSVKPAPAWPARWDDQVADRWLAVEAQTDVALGPFGDAALARGVPRKGERVIDVGCGCGPSTVALADAVGEAGSVLAVDIAPPLLARARERAAGRPQVSFVEADAAVFSFPPGHDLLFSRFGLMFFPNPAAAFDNLARSLAPGGRLAAVCWRPFEENPWMGVPFAALREVLPEAPAPPTEGPGPFALAIPAKTRDLLSGASFREITVEPFDAPVCLGVDVGAAVRLVTHTGPAGRVLATVDEGTRAEVRARIASRLERYTARAGVFLPGAAWVLTARR